MESKAATRPGKWSFFPIRGFSRGLAAAVLGLALLAAVLFAPAVTTATTTGDGSWEWMNPVPQGNPLKSVTFVDANTGWAAGSSGTIMKTADGGATWSLEIPSANCLGLASGGCNIGSIAFRDALNGLAVGDYGTIWKTADGGASWQAKALPAAGCAIMPGGSCAQVQLVDVKYIDAANVVAAGASYAFYSADGGNTWNVASGIDTNVIIDSVSMVGATGYAVGSNGAIFKSTDFGHTWPTRLTSPVSLNEISSSYFTDAMHGYAVSGSQLLRTTDGINWVASSGLPAQLYGVTISGDNLVVTGTSGTILKRTATTNWTDPISTVASGMTAASSGTTSIVFSAAYAGSAAYACGDAGSVVKSVDGGATWSLVAGSNSKGFNSSSFLNDTTGWMIARDGSIIKTSDSGATWTSDNSGIASGTTLLAVQFLDGSTGFTVGTRGGAGVAYKRTGGGAWTAMTLPAGITLLWGLHMVDATHGWAVGFPGAGATSGVALRTSDGQNWTFDAAGLGANLELYSVDATSPDSVWAVGQNTTTRKAVVAKYTAGAWTVTEKSELIGMQLIDMVDGTTGYIAAYGPPSGTNYGDGKVYKTTDGGATWNNTALATTHVMSSVSFLDANTGYAAGGEGRVFKTTNGGATWTLQNLGTGVRLFTISTVPSLRSLTGHVVFIGGDSASILRTKMCSYGKPNLSIRNTATYWGSYSDYILHSLSVDYVMTNNSTNIAYATTITGSSADNGVIGGSAMPYLLGDMAGGGTAPLTLKYTIPSGVTRFRATTLVSAQDGCANRYTYP